MSNFEESIYISLKYEFEEKLGRSLKDEETTFLKWVAEKHSKELK